MLLKKIPRSGLMLLVLGLPITAYADSSSGSSSSPWWLDVRLTGGAWWVEWEQTSDARSRFASGAIDVDYTIEPTLAPWAELEVKLFGLNAKFEYTQAKDEGAKELQTLSAALDYTFGNVAFNARHTRAVFNGEIYGETASQYGSANFETDLQISDLMIYFYDRFGIGIRYFDYAFPQDLYLAGPEGGLVFFNGEPIAGFEDISYEGTFIQLALDNQRLFDRQGWLYSLRYGIGLLEASSPFINQLNTDLAEINAGKGVMSDGLAQFVEIDAGYLYTFNQYVQIVAGYRHTWMQARFDEEANYSLVTDFTTQLSGPYLNLAITY